ncbi:hypothetical protein GCM10008018_56590 [Paenibacillus marchantiophytorum]|uniref:Copper amine oxidase-like N-terminal domain-containing protein n=1 Tax=Paenibacillus marchantiophytorum TaxID=1619310 RepID=A0ABQ1F979_9BACL|nr:WG repeat-containing protein [Paenibacillus marchantiophytorum]GGA03306.1 hypothetical protein GCM10008018_56590 [Paenibacillus marchantiophytorum]
MFKKMISLIAVTLMLWQFGSVVYAEQKVEIKENGEVSFEYLTVLGEKKSLDMTGAIIIKDGRPMVPIFALERYYHSDSAFELLTTQKGNVVSVLDLRNEIRYQMKVGSKKVNVLGSDEVKLREETLSTEVSVHLEGDNVYIPIDIFQLLGYEAVLAGEKKLKINFAQKANVSNGTNATGSAASSSQTLYPVKIGKQYGFMDQVGKVVIKPQFEEAGEFAEGFAAVKVKGKWGYADLTGKIVITPEYHSASRFSEGYAIVSKEDRDGVKFGYINSKGKQVGSIMYEFALAYKENFAPVVTGTHFAFLNRDGRIQIYKFHDDAGSFSEGLARVQLNGKYGYIDKKGEAVIPYQYTKATDFAGGLAAISIDNKWGYIDKEENQIIKVQYEDATPFSEGLAAVQTGGKYGYIDSTGKTVISPNFEYAGAFKAGYAPVKVLGKWGFIDPKGTVVVSPKYEYAYEVAGTLFQVKDAGKTLYLDQKGNPVKPLNDNGKEINLVAVAGKVIEVNGSILDLDVPPVLVEGSTLVPLRSILESLGLHLEWNSETKTIKATKDGTNMVLQVDNPVATVNGKSVTLAVSPKIINGATLVPIRFISESVGAQVDYDSYQPTEVNNTALLNGLNPSFAAKLRVYGEASDTLLRAHEGNSGNLEAATAVWEQAADNLVLIKDALLKDMHRNFDAITNAAPNDADSYLQQAMLIEELGLLYEDKNLASEAEMLAIEAGKIDQKALLFYRLFIADLSEDAKEKSKRYAEIAAVNPYVVLNHVQKNGNYYDAGEAFSRSESLQDYAIFALKKAASSGDEGTRNQAKKLLKDKYKVQL